MRQSDLGKKGEGLATEWLLKQEFKILHRNWRHNRCEVDIIAHRKNILHFIEVKTRKTSAYGPPEESVTPKKIKHLMIAAIGWLYRFPHTGRIQYDVLAITLEKDAAPSFFFIEDVSL